MSLCTQRLPSNYAAWLDWTLSICYPKHLTIETRGAVAILMMPSVGGITFFQESFAERSLIVVTEEVDYPDGDNSRRNLPISRWVRSGRWFNQWFNCSRNLKHLLIDAFNTVMSIYYIFKVSLMMSDDLLFYMGCELWPSNATQIRIVKLP